MVEDDLSLSIRHNSLALIKGPVSLWTRPPALYQCSGSQKSPLSVSEHCNCGDSEVFCSLNPPATVVAHNDEFLNELQLWDHDCYHHSLHLWNMRGLPNKDINDLVHEQLGNPMILLNSLIMGICLCVTTRMLTTLQISRNCRKSAVSALSNQSEPKKIPHEREKQQASPPRTYKYDGSLPRSA